MREVRRATGVAFVCSSLLVACATYIAPDGTELPPDAGNAGDDQGGTENADMGGEPGSQNSSGAGSAMNTAGGSHGGVGGAAMGGRSGGGAGGAGPPLGGSPTGGAGGVTSAGAAGRGGGSSSGAGGGSGAGGSGTSGSGTGGSALGGAGGSSGSAGAGGSGGGTVNLISNFGFEANTTGWSVFGGSATIARSTNEAHSGTRSLLITGRTQTYQGPQYAVLDLITPGGSYGLSLWGKLASSNPTGSLIATFRYTCSGGTDDGDNFMQWVGATAASASTWTRLTAVNTFPTCAGGNMTAAWLYVESPTKTLSYYIDDVVLSAQ